MNNRYFISDEDELFRNLYLTDLLVPLVDNTSNILFLINNNKRPNDIEFFTILTDMITFKNKTKKKALLISYGAKDNIYKRYLQTRFYLAFNFDLKDADSTLDFALRHSIEHPLKLVSINIHDKQIKELMLVINSFIANDIDKIFIRDIELNESNKNLLLELQELAIKNDLTLIVQFKKLDNIDNVSELKNVIKINHLENDTYYLENQKGEKSSSYKVDLKSCKIKPLEDSNN